MKPVKKEGLEERVKLSRELICITGIDGSGKTTHAKEIISELTRSGVKCKYVWLRSAYFLSLPFMFLCRLLGFAVVYNLSNGQNRTEHLYHRKPIALIWPWIQFLDLLLFAIIKICIPLTRGSVLVIDRYVHDILVDLMVDVNNPKLHRSLVGQFILGLMPRGIITFLLDVDEQTALQRKTDIPNYRYLATRRRYYRSIACYLKIPRINTSYSFGLVHEQLLRRLKERRAQLALHRIERQLRSRLQARARWRKWKKGPIAMFRRLIKRFGYFLFGVNKLYSRKVKLNLNLGVDEFGRNVTVGLLHYAELLKRRGLDVHTVLVVGSRAKNRWNPKSDVDTVVIANGFPKGLKKYTVLLDIPIFLGISGGGMLLGAQPKAYTKEDFLQKLEELDLTALDVVYYGKVVVDDGFWLVVRARFKEIEEKYELRKAQLKRKLFAI